MTKYWSNPTCREQTLQLRETTNFQPAKEHPKHSNLNNMKMHRSIQQVKELDKKKTTTPNQTIEEIVYLKKKSEL